MKKIFLLICLSTFPVYGQDPVAEGRFVENIINDGTQLEVTIQVNCQAGADLWAIDVVQLVLMYNNTALTYNSYHGLVLTNYATYIDENAPIVQIILRYVVPPRWYLRESNLNIGKIIFDIEDVSQTSGLV